MKKLIIKRDGIPPISFTGKLIGTSSGYTQTHRRAVITIHRTKGGKFIAVISCKTRQYDERYGTEAASFATAAGVIDWLKQDNDMLNPLSQEAVEEAAKVDPEFAAAWVEEVE